MSKNEGKVMTIPQILAPAGDKSAFLSALLAGADAVYCGLKQFSARMEATNFSLDVLGRLVALAHEHGVQVYVALNSLVKPDEIDEVVRMLTLLSTHIKPDAVIVQDLGVVYLARRLGFSGEIHLSTLANLGHPEGLQTAHELGISRVVIPRELSVDEVRKMAAACPEGLDLEMFVHGALCYCVSGRCYWSSFFGGKSGLRGRCVQPCRRIYSYKGNKKRYFSCRDLSVDVLTKVVLTIPQIRTLKIEGRKKGPHYVYYTVKAYKMLRDEGGDPSAKKAALAFLDQALGRMTTHYNLLPQRRQIPVMTDTQTGSGLYLGNVKGGPSSPYLIPRDSLMPGDLLRIGYEDERGHFTLKLTFSVPKKGRLHLKRNRGNIMNGSPVFLIDRREPMLKAALNALEEDYLKMATPSLPSVDSISPVKGMGPRQRKIRSGDIHGEMVVTREGRDQTRGRIPGMWLPLEASLPKQMRRQITSTWWWLPPVLWPDDEAHLLRQLSQVMERGGTQFVLNTPWQMAWFKGNGRNMNLWAGPFCNVSNGAAIHLLMDMGFSGAIVSPELSKGDYLNIIRDSALPLGIVIAGNWPLGISRTLSDELVPEQMFKSPKNEDAWVSQIDGNNWVFPNWQLDLTTKKKELLQAGFRLFVELKERVPGHIHLKDRPCVWNWSHGLG